MRCAALVLALVACETGPAPLPPAAVLPLSCGEVGPARTRAPTVTPELVAEGELLPAEIALFEDGQLAYREIGTAPGATGPALELELVSEERDRSPWPSERDLVPGRSLHLGSGRYHVEARASDGDPPERVRYRVLRRPCPTSHYGQAPDRTEWLWASTDAIGLHTLDVDGEPLTIGVSGFADDIVTFGLSFRGYDASLALEPGQRGGTEKHRVTIEAVERLPTIEGHGRSHVLVRLDPVAEAHVLPAAIAASGCGEPSPSRTELPSALAPSGVMHEVRVRPDGRVRAGDTFVEFTRDPRIRRIDAAPVYELRVGGESPRPDYGMHLIHDSGWELGRVRTWLFAARREEGAPHAEVRLTTLACPYEHHEREIQGPRYAWISTFGVQRISVGPSEAEPSLAIELENFGFSMRGGDAAASLPIGRNMIGRSFLLGRYEVMIVDMVMGPGTHHSPYGSPNLRGPGGWTYDGLAPALHVQVRIAPSG